ncbi:sulfatase [Anaerobaca lacustris]|uniref:Sulfatase n=1 Tax=Anaerobaca lacustris TaxID=3044600 RepID=A0AAW6TXM7_9BACT|nr:sulfatase [Sedimentisphaerales bacterium M17dextr]
MKRRAFLKGCAASLAGLASPNPHMLKVCAAPPAEMPDTSGMNLLLIHAEGLTANAIGCYGNALVRTPNLDRFATRATRFTRCYCQTPMGNPSRASFLTGLRPDATGILTDGDPVNRLSSAGTRLLPEMLHQYGLHTMRVGRLLDDTGRGRHQHRVCRKSTKVARLLTKAVEEEAPFFLSVDFSALRTPLHCPTTYLDSYDPAHIPAPQAPASRDRDVPDIARRFGRNEEILCGDEGPLPDDPTRGAILAYYACVSFLDAQIGIVLDALDRAGLSRDTIVLIFSNHGFHLGEHGLWGARTLFEQSTRVPLLVRVPGVTTREVVCDEIVELVDLLPTACELLAVPTPDRLEGKSLAPLLCDPLQPWKRAAFTVCATADAIGRSVRTKRWRYTDWQSRTAASRQFELYDLDTDPWEQTNLALNPDYRNERTILANLLQRGWRAAQ